MKRRLQQRRKGTVALAAAILFSLQALFGTFATAVAAAGPAMVDAFGDPLCITHQEQQPTPEPGKDHSLALDCCTLLCGVAAGFMPTDHGEATLFNPLAQPSQRILGGYVAPLGPAHDDLPGHPRGPPLAG